jgi:hypothetical protein
MVKVKAMVGVVYYLVLLLQHARWHAIIPRLTIYPPWSLLDLCDIETLKWLHNEGASDKGFQNHRLVLKPSM